MERFFGLKKNGTTVSTEIMAGLTTFFAMSYIIAVNPSVLSKTGMPWGAVFIATIISAVVGTLIMGLFANVPYAQAPGMGLNAFFTYTVVKGLGFDWQQTLSMVFICGLLNILITVTKVRKMLIEAIPPVIQAAIGGGIGMFIAYVGILNIGLVKFSPDKTSAAGADPGLTIFNTPALWLFLIGLLISLFFLFFKFPGKWSILNRGGFLFSIILTSLIGIPMGQTVWASNLSNVGQAFQQLPTTFLAIFRPKGLPSLFSDPAKLPLILVTILAFSLSDIFDTIGTFVGTGRRAGIFSAEDEKALENGHGFSSKMDRALFADSTATSIGALFGTSNTTTYVESAAGIAAGGRTGLTSVTVAACFLLSLFAAPLFAAIPTAATAPVLILVGCMMMSDLKEIDWKQLDAAVPAFFGCTFMAFSYSISYGIAGAFISYCIVKIFQKKAKDVSPLIWIVSALFILDFTLQAVVA